MSEQPRYRDEERTIAVTGGTRGFLLRTPARLAPHPLLLIHLAVDQQRTLDEETYRLVPDHFLEAGHRVASFDLPNHGKRIDRHGEGLHGMAAAMASGVDVFAGVAEVAREIVNYCLTMRLAQPHRIAVSGNSRGALCALHALAGDHRIAAAAAFAPLTYLPALPEFAFLGVSPMVQRANAMSLVPALSGRAVFVAISAADPRVGTEHCVAFYNALCAGTHGRVELRITPGTTHAIPTESYLSGAAWLLDTVAQMTA